MKLSIVREQASKLYFTKKQRKQKKTAHKERRLNS